MSFLKIKRIVLCTVAITVMLTVSVSSSANGEVLNSGNIYYGNDSKEKLVALTFDDGPHKYRTVENLHFVAISCLYIS